MSDRPAPLRSAPDVAALAYRLAAEHGPAALAHALLARLRADGCADVAGKLASTLATLDIIAPADDATERPPSPDLLGVTPPSPHTPPPGKRADPSPDLIGVVPPNPHPPPTKP